MLARIALLAAFLLAGEARAQEPAKPWKNAAELNLMNTTGNTRVTTFGAKELYNYNWDPTSLEVRAGALTSKDQGRTTSEQFSLGEKGTRKIRGQFYAYEKFGWVRNRFAGILERYIGSLGVGDEWPRGADKLSGEAGAGFVSERRPDKQNNFTSGRLYGKYARALSKTSSFSQDVEYLHNFRYGKDFRLNTETALVASLSTHMALKASYEWKHVGKPSASFIKDDTILSMALLINY